MVSKNGARTLNTTATSLEILELLEEIDGGRVTEIASRMDAPKSTVHGHLTTLRSKQFVVKRGDVYYLGPELLRLGNQVRKRRGDLMLARELTETLFEEVGFRAAFAVEMGGRAVIIHTVSGEKLGWAHERLGNQLYLHNTSFGKAMLAQLPRIRVEQILDRWGLPRETKHTITDREELFAELEEVREQGYATNNQENIEDLYAIGAAATEQSGNIVSGFSITGPKHSMTGPANEHQLAESVSEVANEYELEISLS